MYIPLFFLPEFSVYADVSDIQNPPVEPTLQYVGVCEGIAAGFCRQVPCPHAMDSNAMS
jgi:hypothetical protein